MILKRYLTRKAECPELNIDKAPTFLAVVSSLKARISTWKTAFFSQGVICLAAIGGLWVEKRELQYSLDSKTWSIYTCGEQTNVRPGTIPPRMVSRLMDFTTVYMATFSYDTVRENYTVVEKYMAPDLRQAFRRDWREKIERWTNDKYEQQAHFTPVREFYMIDGRYIGLIKMRVSRWMSGIPVQDKTDYLKIGLSVRETASPVTGEALEIDEIAWLTGETYVNEKSRLDSLGRANVTH